MKKIMLLFMTVTLVIFMTACGQRTINDIMQEEPSLTGIVQAVDDAYILLEGRKEGSAQDSMYRVSLNVENKDSQTHFNLGDEVQVYYNGDIAESDPAQINTVYAILLKTPANRGATLKAMILEIHEKSLLVEPAAGSWERNSSDQITVPMKNMAPSPEPQVGDIIEIVYNGELQESYPAAITEVYSIEVIESEK